MLTRYSFVLWCKPCQKGAHEDCTGDTKICPCGINKHTTPKEG